MTDNETRRFRWRRLGPASMLITIAMFIALTFVAASLAGWREHTTFLSLTPASTGEAPDSGAGLGAAYIESYLLVTIVAPVLVLAAGLCALFQRKVRNSGAS